MIPPYPERPLRPQTPPLWWLTAQDNILAGWSRDVYSRRLIHWRLPRHDVLVANGRDLAHQVLVSEVQHFPKSNLTRRMVAPLLGESVLISESPLWRERRRCLAPLFQSRRLPVFTLIVEQVLQELLNHWQTLPDGAVVDIHRAMTRVTAGVASRAFLARCLGERADAAHAAFRDYQRQRGHLALTDLLQLPYLSPWRGQRCAARLHALLDSMPDGPPGECPRLASLLGDNPTALRDEAATLFLAGHETTASTLSWALYLLARDAHSDQRLSREALALNESPAAPENLAGLHYTRAVVAETLRLYPPLPLLSRDTREARTLGEVRLRPRSLVVVAPWLLHRHRGYWEDADAFRPDRFHPDGPVTRLPAAPLADSYIPFGAGQRVCPGSSFALLEATLVLARLLARYRFEVLAETPVMPTAQLTLTPQDGLALRLWRR